MLGFCLLAGQKTALYHREPSRKKQLYHAVYIFFHWNLCMTATTYHLLDIYNGASTWGIPPADTGRCRVKELKIDIYICPINCHHLTKPLRVYNPEVRHYIDIQWHTPPTGSHIKKYILFIFIFYFLFYTVERKGIRMYKFPTLWKYLVYAPQMQCEYTLTT